MFGFQSFIRGAARMAHCRVPVQTTNKYMISCSQKFIDMLKQISDEYDREISSSSSLGDHEFDELEINDREMQVRGRA